jgi:hypothetical protein
MTGKDFFGTDCSELLTILLFPGFRNYVCVSMLVRVRFVVPLSGVVSCWVSYAYKRQIVSPVGEGYIAVQKNRSSQSQGNKNRQRISRAASRSVSRGGSRSVQPCRAVVPLSYQIIVPSPSSPRSTQPSKVRIQTFRQTGEGIINHAVNLETGEVHAAELFVDTLLLGLRGLSNVFLQTLLLLGLVNCII